MQIELSFVALKVLLDVGIGVALYSCYDLEDPAATFRHNSFPILFHAEM
jgi:hypothetical protein